MRYRLPLIGGLAFVVGVLIALVFFPKVWQGHVPSSLSVGQALIGGPFTLVNQDGKTVTDKTYRGKYMLVEFGYTFCPDVCPTGLQVISAALDEIGPKADKVVPLFISVDTERDTPKQLKQYVGSFNPRLQGLTGTPEEIAAAAKAYRVYYKKVEDPKSTAGYTYDHSALIYLMGPDGKYVTHFPYSTNPDKMAARLKEIL
ncbi:MAG: SCO family protein [Hyphomicrobiaceae bacterium]